MTFADDIASDYTLIDGIEDVSFLQRGGDALTETVTGVKALEEPRARENIMLGPIGMESRVTTWNLWAVTLIDGDAARITPKVDSKITQADGTVWLVKKISRETLATRWRCVCVEAES